MLTQIHKQAQIDTFLRLIVCKLRGLSSLLERLKRKAAYATVKSKLCIRGQLMEDNDMQDRWIDLRFNEVMVKHEEPSDDLL